MKIQAENCIRNLKEEKTQQNLTENKNFKFWTKNNLIFKL